MTKASVGKKELQRQRMMKYFIDAAVKIIREDGIEQVSVRNVANLAGYSYGTIYNYFADLNELLWHAVVRFMREIADYLQKHFVSKGDGVQQLKSAYGLYVKYYLENPNVYRFIAFTQLGNPPDELAHELESAVLEAKQRALIRRCIKDGILPPSLQDIAGDTVTALVHGLLALYFANKGQLSRQQLVERVDTCIDFVFSRDKNGPVSESNQPKPEGN